MRDTREDILLAALRLFARDGYEAASVSAIAGELGMTKSALYKHFASKRNIFDSITERMEQLDALTAREYGTPERALAQSPGEYGDTSPEALAAFAAARFRYWTEDEFSSAFRRLLTLEQYRSDEAMRLYQQYLAAGPLGYAQDVIAALLPDAARAEELAAELCGPLFLLYSVYDGAEDKPSVTARAEAHIRRFTDGLNKEIKIREAKNELSAK